MKAFLGQSLAIVAVLAATVPDARSAAPAMNRVAPVGAGIYEVAVGESTDALYIASTAADARRIFVLDPRSLQVRGTIDTGDRAAYGLAFNNRTRRLYTTDTVANSVSVIDVTTGRVLARIAAPDAGVAHVFRALVDERSNTVYVSLPDASSRIWVIDGATSTLKHEIVNVGGRSTGLALDSARDRLFTSSIASSEIIEIDLASRQVVRRFASGGIGTTHLAFDAASDRLFATHQRSGDVTVLDAGSGTVLKKITTGAGALGLALDAPRKRLYVTNREADTVSVIDTGSYAMVATLRGAALPNTVAVDGRTGDAYATFKSRPGSPDSVARITASGGR